MLSIVENITSITVLLAVVFVVIMAIIYGRKKLNDTDNKIESMFDLLETITNEVKLLKADGGGMGGMMGGEGVHMRDDERAIHQIYSGEPNTIPGQSFCDGPESESESGSDSGLDSESESEYGSESGSDSGSDSDDDSVVGGGDGVECIERSDEMDIKEVVIGHTDDDMAPLNDQGQRSQGTPPEPRNH